MAIVSSKFMLILFLLSALFLTTSCIYVNETYFKINSDGASEIVRNFCRETTPVGPLGTAVFKLADNVNIYVTSAFEAKISKLVVSVMMEVPEGTTIKFEDNLFKLNDVDTRAGLTDRPSSVSHYIKFQNTKQNKRIKDIRITLIGESKTIGNRLFGKRNIHKTYTVTASFFEAHSGRYMLSIPDLKINDSLYIFPEITLTRSSDYFYYPLNC